MKFKIRIVLYVVILTLVTTGVGFSADEKTGLAKLLNLGLKRNTNLKIAKLKLDNAKVEFQKSKLNNLATQSQCSKMQANITLLQARNQYYKTQSQLVKKLITKYSKVLLAKQNLAIKQKRYKLEQIRLNKTKAQVDKGYKNNLALIKQINKFQTAKFDLEQAKNNYQTTLRELKFMINQIKKLAIKFKNLKAPQIWQIAKKEVLKIGTANSINLKIQQKNIKLAQQELKKAQQVLTPKLDLKKLKNNLQIAKLKKDKLKQSLKNSLYTNYYQFKQAIKQLNLRRKDLNQIKKNYNLVDKKAAQGLVSPEEVLASKVQLLQTKYDYQSAVINYYSQELALKTVMRLEVEGLINGFSQE
ncbi:outer membrane protein [Halobacteroides halobius DSM 5150]|uniref:Outer membrane protein n=1 Tax=Halobacteroides halobius (strain ATCC 35273 / DSM 5150 / MD-1) TaxID=748449 RepID=L0KB69_HALHC|nr:TolC family protein [Halobacteroides halobius]AGB41308.1 outer membrane protein [Halobacteroides halobius DSM 5150]